MTTRQKLFEYSKEVENRCRESILLHANDIIDRGLLIPTATSGLYSKTFNIKEELTPLELEKCNKSLSNVVNNFYCKVNGISVVGFGEDNLNFSWKS